MRHLIAIAVGVSACGGARQESATPVDVMVADDAEAPPLSIEPRREANAVEPGVRVVDPARDPRRHLGRPRAAGLLEVETAQLDQLLAATPSGAPDRPALLRRVAEDYCELARARETTHEGEVAAARNRAIEAYTAWLQETPATYAGTDEVRYFLGLEQERAGNAYEARRRFEEIVKAHPSSKFVAAAWVGLGELSFSEARGDASKAALARQAYEEALKFPPPANWLHDFAKERVDKLTEMGGALRVP